MMSKRVGKIYTNKRTWVLCMGSGFSQDTFSGIVVKQQDLQSEHKVGYLSNNWTAVNFDETDERLSITEWKQYLQLDKLMKNFQESKSSGL